MTDLLERRCRLIAELRELDHQLEQASELEAVDALSTPNLQMVPWWFGGARSEQEAFCGEN